MGEKNRINAVAPIYPFGLVKQITAASPDMGDKFKTNGTRWAGSEEAAEIGGSYLLVGFENSKFHNRSN